VHCEFSTQRGPTWASIFRQIDREKNLLEGHMDKLAYPNLFVLDGGYCAFVQRFLELTIGRYRPMLEISNSEIGMARKCQSLYDHETDNQQGTKSPDLTKKLQYTELPHFGEISSNFG
jgi:M-phase inducer tyrosine phosphatase